VKDSGPANPPSFKAPDLGAANPAPKQFGSTTFLKSGSTLCDATRYLAINYASTMAERRRVDALLVERGLAPSRARAQALVLGGHVYSGTRRIDKAGNELAIDAELTVRGEERFVSRGGHKLEGALTALGCAVAGKICADIGASTGGFTDCLLQHGASKVYAIDVGRAQLAEKLRTDARVVVRDETNARHLERSDFAERVELVVVDASFISLEKLLPAIAEILAPGGTLLALVKPQFEVGRSEARRGRGVIRDPELRQQAILRVRQVMSESHFRVLAGVDSSLPGPKGNVEYFLLAERS
jgi:23S rRNA (cytidine1920-2'-O)/16S rRNA (cytidine1409-2'-O)-methyltransferase